MELIIKDYDEPLRLSNIDNGVGFLRKFIKEESDDSIDKIHMKFIKVKIIQ